MSLMTTTSSTWLPGLLDARSGRQAVTVVCLCLVAGRAAAVEFARRRAMRIEQHWKSTVETRGMQAGSQSGYDFYNKVGRVGLCWAGQLR